MTIHTGSKLLHYLFICTTNSYCTILLHVTLKSTLFDTSFSPVSAINCRRDSPCIRGRSPPYFYGIVCVVIVGPTTKTAGSKVLL